MKVLDPFAGYRLASGHPIFHLSLFIGSWIAPLYFREGVILPEYLTETFKLLRWSHFSLCFLAFLSYWANKDTAIPEGKGTTVEEVEKEQLEASHRDGFWKLFGRTTDTISVFMYQGAIFIVQLNVYNNNSVCDADGCSLIPPNNVYLVWLYIEMYCFYMYMVSSVIFIMYHSFLEGVCAKKESTYSDMNKTIMDFLTYENSNLIWFAFNFVLVTMPLVCIFILNART